MSMAACAAMGQSFCAENTSANSYMLSLDAALSASFFVALVSLQALLSLGLLCISLLALISLLGLIIILRVMRRPKETCAAFA